MKLRNLLVTGLLVGTTVIGVAAPADALEAPPPGYTRIMNLHSGLCLAARGTGEQAAVATTCGDWNDQIWMVVTNFSGVTTIMNSSSALCLAARGTGEQAAVVTTCNMAWADQNWTRIGNYQLQNQHSGLCLAARGTGEQAAVVTTCNGNWTDQLWLYDPYY